MAMTTAARYTTESMLRVYGAEEKKETRPGEKVFNVTDFVFNSSAPEEDKIKYMKALFDATLNKNKTTPTADDV